MTRNGHDTGWRPLWLLPVLLLAACAGKQVPVEESATKTARPVVAGDARAQLPEFYTVARGDTLYSIAWRHGIDHLALARLNGIGEPYTIHPGQKLRLRAATGGKGSVAQKPATRPAPAKPATTTPAKPAATPPAVVGKAGWQWPAQGPVLSGYVATRVGPKGIAIGGNNGDPVQAARAGRVVYIGSGLVGYGQLVIVKHDDVYLSAYAHNSRVLVKEGAAVQAGEVIAEMGSTGTDRTKLHFEVRRNGDPIDPMTVLPRR